jgi:hypothetical protein
LNIHSRIHVKLVHTIEKPLYNHKNYEYFFKNITFCHWFVWKKQLWLSKISVNTCKTGSCYGKGTLWDRITQILKYSFKNITFCHCFVWKKHLWLSKNSINTCKTGSGYRQATLWDFITQILNIHSRILHFVIVVFGRNSCDSQRTLSTHIKLVHVIDKPLYGISLHKFWIFIQEYYILSLLCLEETAVTLKELYQHM